MTEASAKIVRVRIERGRSGLFYATSEDLRGLLVVDDDRAQIERRVVGGIQDLAAAAGRDVVAIPAESDGPLVPYVVMGADMIAAALSGLRFAPG